MKLDGFVRTDHVRGQMASWTEERVATLRSLWATGLSASRIAAKLGDVTRNAVIGKAHRLGLSKWASASTTNGSTESPDKASATAQVGDSDKEVPWTSNNPANVSTGTANEEQDGPSVLVTSMERAKANAGSEEALDRPLIENASVLQLTEQTCKWPMGDPGSEGFHFCCRRAGPGMPYCDYHVRYAYQTVNRRREKRLTG